MARKSNSGAHGALHLYRSDNFVDKDPVIGRLQTLIQHTHVKHNDVARLSGVSRTTLRNWFFGPTKRPQYATVAAVTRALGYEPRFVKSRSMDFEREIERAKGEIAAAAAKAERRA